MATTPHDRLFKQIFAAPEDAAGLLRPLLSSALAVSIDWQHMQRQRRSFVDAAAREHHTDLLFTATLRRAGKRRRILIYLLFEHKSQAERFTALDRGFDAPRGSWCCSQLGSSTAIGHHRSAMLKRPRLPTRREPRRSRSR